MVAKWPLEVEIAMGTPMPISVSSTHFALRYEVPKFLPRGGHLCMAMLTISGSAHRRRPVISCFDTCAIKAAAIGGMACLYWVPLAFRSLAMGTYGLSYGEVWQILI